MPTEFLLLGVGESGCVTRVEGTPGRSWKCRILGQGTHCKSTHTTVLCCVVPEHSKTGPLEEIKE